MDDWDLSGELEDDDGLVFGLVWIKVVAGLAASVCVKQSYFSFCFSSGWVAGTNAQNTWDNWA